MGGARLFLEFSRLVPVGEASVTTVCARTVRSDAARRHRRRSLLARPPLRSGPSSSGCRIGRLLRKLWTQQRGDGQWHECLVVRVNGSGELDA